MSVNAVNSSVASYTQRVMSGGGAQASAGPQPGSAAAAVQEAIETPDVTRKEALKGDKVAQRKLQQEQQATQAKAPEPGKGGRVDHDA